MEETSQTISILLQDGHPEGIKKVALANKSLRVYVIPRTKINDIKNTEELRKPALYILSDIEGAKIYIGESEDSIKRLRDHEQSKEFWDFGIVCVAVDNSLEKGDVKFLEALTIEKARAANRTRVENQIVPTRNNLNEFKEPSITQLFHDIKIVLSTLGYPFLDEIEEDKFRTLQLWYLNSRNTKAIGVITNDGFLVTEGSMIDATSQPAFEKNYFKSHQYRQDLLERFAEPVDSTNTIYRLVTNIPFRSVNQASVFCLGATVNAWISWKNKDGRTLDAIIRQGKKF